MNQPPSVAIIILNWNGKADTLACLESVFQMDYPAYRVLVVDNGSTDGSGKLIRERFPAVRLIENGANLGFVGGNNVALQEVLADGDEYALLLNNDTEVAPGFLAPMVAALEADPQAGIAGPTICYYNEPGIIWSAGGSIDWKKGITRMIGLDEANTGQYGTAPGEVDFVTGCALLIKTRVVRQIGGLEEKFFAYYEETEWCVRARNAGYHCLFVPQALIWHKITRVAREASPQVHYYMTRNRLLFIRLARMGLAPLLRTLFLDYGRTLVSWTFKKRWRSKRPQRRAMILAIKDYCTGHFGKVDMIAH
ncbi:MAG: glycosyltransferase family 2 protein [Chloroflexi bacterium]|jgi:GT2 family glycosyltransferase|nr:glycosyltransferase family 2 protein [Chloroflexota bacterium]